MNHTDYDFPDNYFKLNIYLTELVPPTICKKYKELAHKNNQKFDRASSHFIEQSPYIDAGIDLFCLSNQSILNGTLSNKIDLGINVRCLIYLIKNGLEKL